MSISSGSSSLRSSSSKLRTPLTSLPDNELVKKFENLASKAIKEIADRRYHNQNYNFNVHKSNNSWKIACPICSQRIGVSIGQGAIIMSNYRSHLKENHKSRYSKDDNVEGESDHEKSSDDMSEIDTNEQRLNNTMSFESSDNNTNTTRKRTILSEELENEIRTQLIQSTSRSSAQIVIPSKQTKQKAAKVRKMLIGIKCGIKIYFCFKQSEPLSKKPRLTKNKKINEQ
jgi:transcription elongation factor Elf1